jgi:hypothetical protein
MCDRDRIILRAAKALARSPAARCIDENGIMPWMPMIADDQVIRGKAGDVPLHEIERRELEAFTRRMRDIFGPWLNGIVADADSRRLDGRAKITYIAQQAQTMAPQLATLIAEAAGPYGQFMARAGVAAGLDQIQQAMRLEVGENVIFDEASEYAVQAARDAANRVGDSAAGSYSRRVGDTIARGIEELKTTDEVIADLEAQGFDEMTAARIARTESVRAYTDGQIEGWLESGVITRMLGLLSPTSFDFCLIAAMEYGEQGVELDQPFFRAGDRIVATDGRELNLGYGDVSGPPLHPFCRCTLVPVIDA